jgi:hypothetical protein
VSWWWALFAVPVGAAGYLALKPKHRKRLFRWLRVSTKRVQSRAQARRRVHWSEERRRTDARGRRRGVVQWAQPTAAGAVSTGVYGRARQARLRRRCTAACRTSTAPRNTCTCPCGGHEHGTYVKGTRANIMNTPLTAEQRARSRKFAEDQRRRKWEQKQRERVARTKAPT